jgi:hypothetical protein
MINGSHVCFRPGSRLASALGVPSDAVGTVTCKYVIANRLIGSPERIDVKFDGNKFAWGVPVTEFVLFETDPSHSEAISQVA